MRLGFASTTCYIACDIYYSSVIVDYNCLTDLEIYIASNTKNFAISNEWLISDYSYCVDYFGSWILSILLCFWLLSLLGVSERASPCSLKRDIPLLQLPEQLTRFIGLSCPVPHSVLFVTVACWATIMDFYGSVQDMLSPVPETGGRHSTVGSLEGLRTNHRYSCHSSSRGTRSSTWTNPSTGSLTSSISESFRKLGERLFPTKDDERSTRHRRTQGPKPPEYSSWLHAPGNMDNMDLMAVFQPAFVQPSFANLDIHDYRGNLRSAK